MPIVPCLRLVSTLIDVGLDGWLFWRIRCPISSQFAIMLQPSNPQHCALPPCLPADPKILLLNIELELKSEKENAEIRLDDPAKYQSIVDAGAASMSAAASALDCCIAHCARA
jgi:hypothetical protein